MSWCYESTWKTKSVTLDAKYNLYFYFYAKGFCWALNATGYWVGVFSPVMYHFVEIFELDQDKSGFLRINFIALIFLT